VVYMVAGTRFTAAAYGEPMPPFELLPGGLALLQSALAAPRWQYHVTIHEKAAALFRSIVKNHALKDGNKRLGVTALDVFLRINRVDLKVSQRNLVETAVVVAAYAGNFPLELLTRWIRAGCSGRPRRIVAIAAEQWPQIRGVVTALMRDIDRTTGRGPRIPGTRVRKSAAVARRMAEIQKQAEQQRLALGDGPTS
jgi:death-on-curing protein